MPTRFTHGRLLVGELPQIMFNASSVLETVHDASQFCFEGINKDDVKINWGAMKTRRDNYVKRLNGIYQRMLDNAPVTRIEGTARFVGEKKVVIEETGEVVEGDHVLVATGGHPRLPNGMEGVLSWNR